jgi:TPR repeat protein
VPVDKVKAFQLCSQGAEQDDPDTLGELGEMYLAGDGVARDPAKAADLLRRAAERDQANAARLLGLMYFNGDGVPHDPNLARDWLMRAAGAGRRDAFLPLGKLFFVAAGDLAARKPIEKHALPALFWLELASEYEPLPERRTEARKLYDKLAPLTPQLVKQLEPELKAWRASLGKP